MPRTLFEFNGVNYFETGVYEDTLTAVNGCDSIIEINLGVIDTEVEIIGEHVVAPGDTVGLMIQPANDSVVWTMDGDTLFGCLNSNSCVGPINEDTEFGVTVVDENGCIATDTHAVFAIVQCFPENAEMPNVFTPNNDNINDTFSIVAPDSEEVLQLRVWDRWGRKVYDGPGPWDGTYNGDPVAPDVYIYDVLVGCPVGVEGDEVLLQGDVTLIR